MALRGRLDVRLTAAPPYLSVVASDTPQADDITPKIVAVPFIKSRLLILPISYLRKELTSNLSVLDKMLDIILMKRDRLSGYHNYYAHRENADERQA